MAQFDRAMLSTPTIGGCLCGMSATRTLNVQRRICRRRKCQQVSFLLNLLHENGSPTLVSRTTPRTPSLVLRTHLSESQSKARHVRSGAIVSIGAKSPLRSLRVLSVNAWLRQLLWAEEAKTKTKFQTPSFITIFIWSG